MQGCGTALKKPRAVARKWKRVWLVKESLSPLYRCSKEARKNMNLVVQSIDNSDSPLDKWISFIC